MKIPISSCRPTKVVLVGLNYIDHARELGMEIPKNPLIFKPKMLVSFISRIMMLLPGDYEKQSLF